MKKLIFATIVSTFLYSSVSAQCGFTVDIDSCCITVSVIENEYPRWILEFGDDGIITSSEVDSTVATYCFDTIGNFKINLTYLDEYGEPGCGSTEFHDIDTLCIYPCVQWMCWEMLGGCCQMDSITGFEIIVNGNPVIIPLPHTYVAGSYQWLSDTLVTIMESYNYNGDFQSYMPEVEECRKANLDLIPGFFFINSEIEVVRILGVVNCAGPFDPPHWVEAKVEFNSEHCDF